MNYRTTSLVPLDYLSGNKQKTINNKNQHSILKITFMFKLYFDFVIVYFRCS